MGATVLNVERLTREGFFTDVSFEVKAGEIVALAGLVGAGRSEVARAIFGIDRYDAGAVTVSGRGLRRASPTAAMAAGVGLVPEDRRQQGLVMDLVDRAERRARVARAPAALRVHPRGRRTRASRPTGRCGCSIKYGRLANPASSLSGGNQQKVVLAKWLGAPPSAADRRRADARHRRRAPRPRCTGCSTSSRARAWPILMISSELPEVLRVADRILVMREGRLVAELTHTEATEERIVAAATGQVEEGAA